MINRITLLLFIGLAWGQHAPFQPKGFQDVLYLKTGEKVRGFAEKVDGQIEVYYYNQNLKLAKKNFQINDIETIVTKDGEFIYPFDISKKGIFGLGRKKSGNIVFIGGVIIAGFLYTLVNGV